ncbi:hypothetical protein PV11_08355 [Exophiala sideris]|uniref:Amidase domain-containing protein n=1 Tax=Exophiala sideris TaxID=1016849 RepID=A0A0D1Z1Y5_9EURO|nr:hypothetical protein PV11_08355 [Exophiala sideris]
MKEWKPRPKPKRKLRIGVMESDGVVMPHPPIIRALRATTDLLRAAGHDVIDFEPYESQKAWDIARDAARDDYKKAYLRHWNETATKTKSKQPIDVLLCPCAPSASFPHDFLPWWGYGSQFNMLDYPGVIIPVGAVDKILD